MWLMTPNGFYSAVKYDVARDFDRRSTPDIGEDDPHVIVRCRAREDAEYLADFTASDVYESSGADYQFRVFLPEWLWVRFLIEEGENITYTNFKDEVKARQGSKRAAAYMRVWDALARIQPSAPYAQTFGSGGMFGKDKRKI